MKPRWNEMIGVFGGAFDPPHVGHLEAARGLLESPGLKKILVLPTAVPPHKKAIASFQDRFEMAKLTFEPLKGRVEVSDFEYLRNRKTHKPNFSYDTISELKKFGVTLAFVIGLDQLVDLPRWHQFPAILGLCNWIVLERQGEDQEASFQMLSELTASGLITEPNLTRDGTLYGIKNNFHTILVVKTPAPPVSSTKLRETLAKAGEIQEELLVSSVHGYLNERGLYGSPVHDEKI